MSRTITFDQAYDTWGRPDVTPDEYVWKDTDGVEMAIAYRTHNDGRNPPDGDDCGPAHCTAAGQQACDRLLAAAPELLAALRAALWIADCAIDADIHGRKGKGCIRDGITRRLAQMRAAIDKATTTEEL